MRLPLLYENSGGHAPSASGSYGWQGVRQILADLKFSTNRTVRIFTVFNEGTLS